MEHKTKIIIKIILILLLFIITLGGAITCIVFWPIIAGPICVVLLLIFFLWKNR